MEFGSSVCEALGSSPSTGRRKETLRAEIADRLKCVKLESMKKKSKNRVGEIFEDLTVNIFSKNSKRRQTIESSSLENLKKDK